MTAEQFTAGTPVIVFHSTRSIRDKYPKGFAGVVTRVTGRFGYAEFTEVYTARNQQHDREREIRFNLASGLGGNNEFIVKSHAQVEEERCRRTAIDELAMYGGLVFKPGRAGHVETPKLVQLAEFVRAWSETEEVQP